MSALVLLEDLFDAYLSYREGLFAPAQAQNYFQQLLSDAPWQQPDITVFGKTYATPRLSAWYGDEAARYSYSGITHQPLPWTPLLLQIKRVVELETGCAFNAVLLNRYRSGQDSNGWHADNEPELCEESPIASVSFGASRRFRLRNATEKSNTAAIELRDNSLLIMKPGTQRVLQHCLPKTAKLVGERINLTFRCIRL